VAGRTARVARDEGGDSTFAAATIPGSATGAVTRLHGAQDRLLYHVASVDEPALETPTRTHWGEELPLWQLLWTSIVEQFHHGAEIGALRDSKRGHANTDWWPELQGADWWPEPQGADWAPGPDCP
jgi:hypothetical protein